MKKTLVIAYPTGKWHMDRSLSLEEWAHWSQQGRVVGLVNVSSDSAQAIAPIEHTHSSSRRDRGTEFMLSWCSGQVRVLIVTSKLLVARKLALCAS